MDQMSELRPSPIAGQWYSRDADRLSRQVDEFIEQAELQAFEGEVIGLIAPHAGHRYSGRTAGHAYKSVLGKKFDVVVIVSPMHGFSMTPLLTSGHKGYNTPLGPVWINRQDVEDLSKIIQENLGSDIVFIYEDTEHSIEIHLPFLQRAIGDSFSILPVMVHSRSIEIAQCLGQGLAQILDGRSALLIASTDLSHFSPQSVANQLDHEMLRQIAAFSPEGVLKAEHTGTGLACGAVPVASVLWACQKLGANEVKVVHYSTSGDETGDYSSVVGYGAALILKNT